MLSTNTLDVQTLGGVATVIANILTHEGSATVKLISSDNITKLNAILADILITIQTYSTNV